MQVYYAQNYAGIIRQGLSRIHIYTTLCCRGVGNSLFQVGIYSGKISPIKFSPMYGQNFYWYVVAMHVGECAL